MGGAFLLVPTLVSCAPALPSGEGPSRPPSSGVAQTSSGPAGSRVDPPRDEASLARDLLERWLHAQNSGDHALYESMYAKNFAGVRRSGESTLIFDREGWLEDRRAMASARPRVGVSRVELATSPGRATLRFVQRWSSASYEDVGGKQLVLKIEDGRAWIESEVMLSSRVLPGRGRSAWNFVLPGGVAGEPRGYLVLHTPGWRDEDHDFAEELGLRLPDVGETGSASWAALPIDAVSSEWRELNGQSVTLLDELGRVCKATIDGFSFVDTHAFGDDDGDEDDDDGPEIDGPEIDGWSGELRHLAARLRFDPHCDSIPVIGRLGDGPRPHALRRVEDAALAQKVVAELEQLTSYRSTIAAIARQRGSGGSPPRVEVAIFQFEGELGDMVAIASVSGGDVCDGAWHSTASVFRSSMSDAAAAAPKLEHEDVEGLADVLVRAAFDLEGDGSPEFFVSEHLWWDDHLVGANGDVLVTLVDDNYHCPC